MGKPRMLGYNKPYIPNNRERQRFGVPNLEENMSKKDWKLLKAYMATGMAPEDFQRIKEEQEAMLKSLKEYGGCETCANAHDDCPVKWGCEGCNRTGGCPCYSCEDGNNWRWRGLKEK